MLPLSKSKSELPTGLVFASAYCSTTTACHGSRAPLGSATSLGWRSCAFNLYLGHRGVRLRECGVNANAIVHMLLGKTSLYRDANALYDLASIRPEHMHADDFLVLL